MKLRSLKKSIKEKLREFSFFKRQQSKDLKRIGAFISIPKNASKAVLDILDLGPNRGKEYTDSLVIYENHQRGKVLQTRHQLKDLFVFCFVRNPYDRCISWYEYHKQRNIEPYNSMSFEDWVKKGLPHHWKKVTGTNWAEEGLTPLLQYNFIEHCKIDFIGKMENFEHDLQCIIGQLNAICSEREIMKSFQYAPKKTNSSKRQGNIEQYYTKETKDVVFSLLAKDFTHFGYDK